MPHSVKEKQPENRWSPEEDKILLSAIEQCGSVVVWSQVSACLPGRNSKSCRKRWVRSLDPTLRKGRWTEEEDVLLTTAVEAYGTQWFQVAKMLHGRTDDQCAKRWRENLDPSISRKPWTKEDDELLMKTYENIGRRWKDLASRFEGRPPVHCRNRVQSLVRARRRAAAASRKAVHPKLSGKPVAGKGVMTTGLDYKTGDTSAPSEEDFVSPRRSRDAPLPTPSPYVTDLHQTIQETHCAMFVPTHPIQKINENLTVPSASSQQRQHSVLAHHPGSHMLYQGSHSQSAPTSPALFGTPPRPPFSRSHTHGENAWNALPSQPQSSTSLDPEPISPGWNASCSYPQQPEQASVSRFPQCGAGELVSTLADPCHPHDYWWPQDITQTYSGRFSHKGHHSQVFDPTLSNYFTSYLPQGLSDSEFMYPLLPDLFTTPLV